MVRGETGSEIRKTTQFVESKTFQVLTLLIGVATVAVAVFFGVTEQKRKDLAVHYLAKFSLITAQATPAGSLKVSYNDLVVESPWVISARLENIGDKPVQKSDIERPLSLRFDSGNVLGVEISSTDPEGIEARATYEDEVVVINHGLLNPGDSIGFEILLDGVPNWPKASFRISEIAEPTILLPTEKYSEVRATYFPLSRPIEFVFLSIASIIFLAILVLGIGITGSGIANSFKRPDYVSFYGERDIEFKNITYSDVRLSLQSRLLLAASDLNYKWEWLENPDLLQELLSEKLAPSFLRQMGLNFADYHDAAEHILNDLRSEFPNAIARTLGIGLPKRAGKRMEKAIREMELKDLTAYEIIENAQRVAVEISANAFSENRDSSVRARIEFGQITFGLFVVFIGISGSLILSGTWRLMLAL